MNESEMYERLKKNLDSLGLKDYKVCKRKARISKIMETAGQHFIELDVVVYKESEVWDIECKKPCTIEQFGFTLGQVIAYKTLLEETSILEQLGNKLSIEKIERKNFAIALLTSAKYPIKEQMKKTFKAILNNANQCDVGFITIDEETKKVTKHW